MPPVVEPPPELLGQPLAAWALAVSLCSFAIASIALVWQIVKHFLDGGRVRVYLNTAVWQPEFMVATNRSGRFEFKNDQAARAVTHGRGLELAQLVIENPGKVPVTIYSPGFLITGHGKKEHTVSPRSYVTGDGYGPDAAIGDSVVRLEPYGRVTFLLDYLSILPLAFEDDGTERVWLRGHVGVAGRTRRPQKSSRRRRWRIERDTYTSIVGSPDFTPFSVMWRAMYPQLPEKVEDEVDRHPMHGKPITRGMLRYILDEAMARFEVRPERAQLETALEEIAKSRDDKLPMLPLMLYEAYDALDRMDGHLTGWTEGLAFARRAAHPDNGGSGRATEAPSVSGPASTPDSDKGEVAAPPNDSTP
ncbi:hypothetical protein C5B85_10880 [Pseudoclavibacter sp. AY1F1]|uniref:hypothetical protein n=1 Tax=Pseudoclavibacter sp. AY1F1 TaxID=2080583 RepID=UPI000CE78DDF|nr:hypothetical protein [Pseudoclavibacter sp. AY1F1]PPF44142.1 hypothetical protein C5B85_10880 [Pseudoclavibacter sp. AY1F1]